MCKVLVKQKGNEVDIVRNSLAVTGAVIRDI